MDEGDRRLTEAIDEWAENKKPHPWAAFSAWVVSQLEAGLVVTACYPPRSKGEVRFVVYAAGLGVAGLVLASMTDYHKGDKPFAVKRFHRFYADYFGRWLRDGVKHARLRKQKLRYAPKEVTPVEEQDGPWLPCDLCGGKNYRYATGSSCLSCHNDRGNRWLRYVTAPRPTDHRVVRKWVEEENPGYELAWKRFEERTDPWPFDGG